ncbi:MAG: hypothetical protein AABX44_02105 [Nanoarchaeota archaeon]
MSDEIKKINSLEEIKIGDCVKIKNYSKSAIFEGTIGKEYGFIEINYPVIWRYRINKKDIQFEDGIIQVEKEKLGLKMYNQYDVDYKEKLKLIARYL